MYKHIQTYREHKTKEADSQQVDFRKEIALYTHHQF